MHVSDLPILRKALFQNKDGPIAGGNCAPEAVSRVNQIKSCAEYAPVRDGTGCADAECSKSRLDSEAFLSADIGWKQSRFDNVTRFGDLFFEMLHNNCCERDARRVFMI
jgi:hypothetical protein